MTPVPPAPTPPPVFDFHARLVPQEGAAARLLGTMDAHGITRAAVSAGGTIPLDLLSRQLVEGGHIETDADNDAVLAACRTSGGRLVPFHFANPHREPGAYAGRAAEFRGLEISPAVHGVPFADPRTHALVEIAERHRHPVYTVCLHRPGAMVRDLAALAAAFPRVTFVLGHSGVGEIDLHGIGLIKDSPNVLLETSGGYSAVIRLAVERLGARRLLFGTEHPLQHPAVELAKYAALGLEHRQLRQILWHNAADLLGPEDPL
ncbi:hypothetical protein BX286_4618 [Streptomyces sp. 3211.6]|uniref:amidohydrolase family protein n=1 Tax=Streptomyces sp. 3211.6 TaxID=1938845 RepID=UPI000F262408|nr:amidohydrolase family protein [Streptomyces sp. 3211.6]RKT06574.1 hypothetical protein BX286_4618 [Streptomyces sp. 3211.6]